MGKRYYCDYCERSFPDRADNRKKHINGVQHRRQLKLHYDAFRDAETILNDELMKKPCKRYGQTGYCEYETACCFSHLTSEDIYHLKRQAKKDKLEKLKKGSFVPPIDHNAFNAIINKVTKRENMNSTRPEQNPIEDALDVQSWKLPPELQRYPDLPPSLLPPTVEDIITFGESAKWG